MNIKNIRRITLISCLLSISCIAFAADPGMLFPDSDDDAAHNFIPNDDDIYPARGTSRARVFEGSREKMAIYVCNDIDDAPGLESALAKSFTGYAVELPGEGSWQPFFIEFSERQEDCVGFIFACKPKNKLAHTAAHLIREAGSLGAGLDAAVLHAALITTLKESHEPITERARQEHSQYMQKMIERTDFDLTLLWLMHDRESSDAILAKVQHLHHKEGEATLVPAPEKEAVMRSLFACKLLAPACHAVTGIPGIMGYIKESGSSTIAALRAYGSIAYRKAEEAVGAAREGYYGNHIGILYASVPMLLIDSKKDHEPAKKVGKPHFQLSRNGDELMWFCEP